VTAWTRGGNLCHSTDKQTEVPLRTERVQEASMSTFTKLQTR